jgi:predicted acyl esterase
VLVSQDVRGRGASAGVFEPFFDDKVDGKATIEWAAKQPWSTGAVATYSNSAEGIVQYMAMANAPEGLRCAHLGMPTHDVYEGLFPGGAWRTELGTRWLTDLGAASVIDLWKSHEARDDYWADATLSTKEMATIDHPVFIMGGFFDIFANSEVRALQELQTHVAADTRDDIFLILGPWSHGGIGLRGQGDLLYPEDAPYLKWVDELLSYVKWCTQAGPAPSSRRSAIT